MLDIKQRRSKINKKVRVRACQEPSDDDDDDDGDDEKHVMAVTMLNHFGNREQAESYILFVDILTKLHLTPVYTYMNCKSFKWRQTKQSITRLFQEVIRLDHANELSGLSRGVEEPSSPAELALLPQISVQGQILARRPPHSHHTHAGRCCGQMPANSGPALPT
ncbi:hypothetical protein J6590_099334 [Homalodisca vitripennis]|nr:hypothetical protein J6590_099334 [Homalodisca vitripennis]